MKIVGYILLGLNSFLAITGLILKCSKCCQGDCKD